LDTLLTIPAAIASLLTASLGAMLDMLNFFRISFGLSLPGFCDPCPILGIFDILI